MFRPFREDYKMAGEPETGNRSRKKRTAVLIFLTAAALVVAGIFAYRAYSRTHVSTDDAFIDGRIHVVSSRVPGTVEAVHVEDNQPVRAGDLLLEIDDRDYDVRVRAALSALNSEKAELAEMDTKIAVAENRLSELRFRTETAKAQLNLQEANLRQAEADLKRAEALFAKEILPREQFDKAVTGHDIARAQVNAAKKQLDESQAAAETQKAVILQAESARQAQESEVRRQEELLKAEELKKSYTKIFAPAEGYVTKKAVEKGNRVGEGRSLMTIVSLEDIWVTANYKETQLENVKPGQKVRIRVDSYPGDVFQGTVESIMAGTGSVFSLFPPENATGNYVKVVQRIPVKIRIDEENAKDRVLRVGMSVVPTILTEERS